jgi:hypothetical protein
MTQNLEGIDIYHCPFFEVDSSGKLKFISGKYYDRTPDSFKTLNDIYEVLRYCMWIVKKKDALDISKYAAIAYINIVNVKLGKIEREYRNALRKIQLKDEESLKNNIDKPGRTYI